MTTAQQEAAARLHAARVVSHHRAREAQRANDRLARAKEEIAAAETEHETAHASSNAAQAEHAAALRAAIALGYRHSHRIDAQPADDWKGPTQAQTDTDKRTPEELAAAYPRRTYYTHTP